MIGVIVFFVIGLIFFMLMANTSKPNPTPERRLPEPVPARGPIPPPVPTPDIPAPPASKWDGSWYESLNPKVDITIYGDVLKLNGNVVPVSFSGSTIRAFGFEGQFDDDVIKWTNGNIWVKKKADGNNFYGEWSDAWNPNNNLVISDGRITTKSGEIIPMSIDRNVISAFGIQGVFDGKRIIWTNNNIWTKI